MTPGLEIPPPADRPESASADVSHVERARMVHERLGLEGRLRLVAIGVPYDVAMALEGPELYAYSVAAGEVLGGRFDWAAGAWVDLSLNRG